MSNPFDRPRAIFPNRVAPYNPNRDLERARTEARRELELAKLRERPRTLFDVQDHLERTGRQHLMPNISSYNQPAVENALSQDLDQALSAGDANQATRLRHMIYLAATEGFPGAPAFDQKAFQETLKHHQTALLQRIEESKRAGEYDSLDEQEDAQDIEDWATLVSFVSDPHGTHDLPKVIAALKILENALHFAYRDLNAPGPATKRGRSAKLEYSRLRDVRNAVYWLVFRNLERKS